MSQSHEEEASLSPPACLLRQPSEEPLDTVEQSESGDTKGSIQLGIGKVLESVDDNFVGGRSGVEEFLNTEDSWELTSGNIDSGTSHESRHGGLGNCRLCQQENSSYGDRILTELDDPSHSEETDGEHDETADEGEAGGDFWCGVQVSVLFEDF